MVLQAGNWTVVVVPARGLGGEGGMLQSTEKMLPAWCCTATQTSGGIAMLHLSCTSVLRFLLNEESSNQLLSNLTELIPSIRFDGGGVVLFFCLFGLTFDQQMTFFLKDFTNRHF